MSADDRADDRADAPPSSSAATPVELAPIGRAWGELAVALMTLGVGVVLWWLPTWADRLPVWLVAAILAVGRDGVLDLFAGLALLIASNAVDVLRAGGRGVMARILAAILWAGALALLAHVFATGHVVLGAIGALLVALGALAAVAGARRRARTAMPSARVR